MEVIAQSLDLPTEVVKQAAQPFHEQNLAAFIELLNSQRSLFSPQDLAELAQLIAPLSSDIEELSKAIALWCTQKEHSSHLNALRQVRQTLTNTPDYPLTKQTLQHALEQISASN